MADHLIQEQRGSGATYRRTSLQKFTDYVNEENDIPIYQFINRNNSAEEAIGYGKVLMMNNMLRNDLGDEAFIKAYQKFYMHNSGHWLGLDVHDVGTYKINGEWRKLEAGHLLTVEPGI